MGLTQDFTGLVEPADPDFKHADSTTRKQVYDTAGKAVLDQLSKQLGRGIGRNGREMKARIQAVLPDGADGPVMEPHYEASRVITLADYAATDHGLKLFWHAGTGHRQHRRARARGKKAPAFGQILQWHADGEVPNAPVRDVRLCKARLTNVRRMVQAEWAKLKKRKLIVRKREPEPTPGPQRPTPATLPTPARAPTPATRPKAAKGASQRALTKRVIPPPVNPPKPITLKPGAHPTPTHPITVVDRIPKGRVKGPTFVITGRKPKR
jgi:hypothetical protein